MENWKCVVKCTYKRRHIERITYKGRPVVGRTLQPTVVDDTAAQLCVLMYGGDVCQAVLQMWADLYYSTQAEC